MKELATTKDVAISYFSLTYTVAPALFLIVYAFFRVRDDVEPREVLAMMRLCLLTCLAGTVLMFMLPPMWWYALLAVMGIATVMYIIGWSYFYTRAVPVYLKMKVMALVIIAGNIIYYLVNLTLSHFPLVIMAFVICMVLLACLLISQKMALADPIIIPLKHAPFPAQLILVACLYFFVIKLNGGLTFHVIDPVFDTLFRGQFDFYVMLPYLVTLFLLFYFGDKLHRLFPIYLGTFLLGVSYLSFILYGQTAAGYFLTETLLQSGWAIIDLYLWTLFGLIASVYGRPLKICSFAFLANLMAGFAGGATGVYLVGTMENIQLWAASFAIMVIFFTYLIMPWLQKRVEHDIFNYGNEPIQETAAATTNQQDTINKLLETVLPQFALLSSREKNVAELLVQGLSNKDISATLDISENTVKSHTKNIYAKMKLKNKKELVQKAYTFRQNL